MNKSAGYYLPKSAGKYFPFLLESTCRLQGWQERRTQQSNVELQEQFDKCSMHCRVIKDGKLHYCAHAMTSNEILYQLNDTEDTLDLSGNNPDMKKIILEYHMGFTKNGYIQMCKHCNGYININNKLVSVAEQIEN